MPNENAVRLASTLLTKTKAQEVQWEDDPFYNGYLLTVRSGKCRVYYDNEGELFFSVYNENDISVENLSERSLEHEIFFRKDELRELYEAARRNALKADEVIDKIMNELSDDLPF